MNKEAIEFYRWMMKNDTVENAEKYFHEFLKQKHKYKSSDGEENEHYGEDKSSTV